MQLRIVLAVLLGTGVGEVLYACSGALAPSLAVGTGVAVLFWIAATAVIGHIGL